MEETTVVESTKSAEEIVSSLASEEKKQELLDKLNKLKKSLNIIESRQMGVVNEHNDDLLKNTQHHDLEFNITLLNKISKNLRENIIILSQYDTYSEIEPVGEAIDNLSKINKIYKSILEKLDTYR